MWRRLGAGKSAFSELSNNSTYELVATEEEDSANENHRLLTNGYRRQAASSNNFYPTRATDDNTLISSSYNNSDSNQNHYSRIRVKREGSAGGEEYELERAEDGDAWSQEAKNARKMLRRPSERDTSRISSVDNPNYCSVNMAMSVEDVPDATRTPPENRRTSSPYNVMSTADDPGSSEPNSCLRALSSFFRCTFWYF